MKLKYTTGETVRRGDFVEIISRPFEGPEVGAIVKVLSVGLDSIYVEDRYRSSGKYGKTPGNVRFSYNELALDEGL